MPTMNTPTLSEENVLSKTNPMSADLKKKRMSQDTQDCVNILLKLKNRSETSEDEDPQPLIPLSCDQVLVIDVESDKLVANDSSDDASSSSSALLEERTPATEASLEKLLDGSELVLLGDCDLVPEPLFFSMAQMKPCRLLEGDRVGSYKGRPVGFIGFCCKHCGGQPGYGKFFPNSVRSLAQTTTSQTIVKHVAAKCRFTPPHVRQAVIDFQRQLLQNEKSNDTRPRYGSRKVFFQRIWSRLHDDDLVISSVPSPQTDHILENVAFERQQVEAGKSDVSGNKKKVRGKASNQSNLKRKSIFADSQSLKHYRTSGYAKY